MELTLQLNAAFQQFVEKTNIFVVDNSEKEIQTLPEGLV